MPILTFSLMPSDLSLYAIQLMVNDGQVNSQPSKLTVTVLPSPNLALVTQTSGSLGFSWPTIAGRQYQVQCTTDLLSGVWQNLGSPVTATNAALSASDIIRPDPKRFYRVALTP